MQTRAGCPPDARAEWVNGRSVVTVSSRKSIGESDEQRALGEQLLIKRFTELDSIRKFLDDQRWTVHPRSPLAGDDAAIRPFHVSNLAVFGLGVAVDNLTSIQNSVERIVPFAMLSTLRPAYEVAAHIIWMLAPTKRDERIVRALQLHRRDQFDADQLAAAFGMKRDRTMHETDAKLQSLADARPGVAGRSVKVLPSTQSILAEADSHVPGAAVKSLPMWKACSGMSHARPSAALLLLEREEVDYDGARGEHTYQVTLGVSALAMFFHGALEYTYEAIRLYQTRNTPPS